MSVDRTAREVFKRHSKGSLSISQMSASGEKAPTRRVPGPKSCVRTQIFRVFPCSVSLDRGGERTSERSRSGRIEKGCVPYVGRSDVHWATWLLIPQATTGSSSVHGLVLRDDGHMSRAACADKACNEYLKAGHRNPPVRLVHDPCLSCRSEI